MKRTDQSDMRSLRGMIRDGAFISALELCQKLLHHDQNNPYLWLACSEILEKLERFEDAVESLQAAKKLNGAAIPVVDREIQLCRAVQDERAEFAALIKKGCLCSSEELKHWYWIRLSKLAWEAGEKPLATKALGEAFAHYEREATCREDGTRAIQNLSPAMLSELLPVVLKTQVTNCCGFEALFYARMLEGQSSLAIEALLQARKIAPDNCLPKDFPERFKREEIDWDVFEALVLDHASGDNVCPELIWLLAWYRQYSGRLPEAVDLIKAHLEVLRAAPLPRFMAALDFASSAGLQLETLENGALSPMAAFQRAVNEDRWGDAISHTDNDDLKSFVRQAISLLDSGKQRLSHPNLKQEVIVSGPERPNGIVFVFTGLADALIVPINLIDVFLADLGLTAVYCRDFQRMIGCNGIATMGDDFESSIAGFEGLVEQLGAHKPVFTMGNSAGGYLAGIYGSRLNAKAMLLFSPVYSVDSSELRERFDDRRARIVIRRINRTCDLDRLRMSDALQTLPDARVTAYVPTGNNEDARHAQAFALHPNVKVHELENFSGHATITRAAGRHGFLNIVKDAYGL